VPSLNLVKKQLLAAVGQDDVSRTRKTLAVLCDMGAQARGDEEGDH
jgi:hypothetical protein